MHLLARVVIGATVGVAVLLIVGPSLLPQRPTEDLTRVISRPGDAAADLQDVPRAAFVAAQEPPASPPPARQKSPPRVDVLRMLIGLQLMKSH